MRDFRLGVQVDFEGDLDAGIPSSKSASPISPAEEFRRAHPLSPDVDCATFGSPGCQGSPSTDFSSFTYPGQQYDLSSEAGEAPGSYARLAQARRRASVLHSRMTTTASQVWYRAIARAHGSVSFAPSILDVSIILPSYNPPPPRSARSSLPELSPPIHLPSSGLLHKPSNRSLRSESGMHNRLDALSSPNTFNGWSKTHRERYVSQSNEGGYEKLLTIEGESRAMFGLGFGPKKGLLGEDTLRAKLEVGRLHTSLGAGEKLQRMARERIKAGKESQQRIDKWGPRSMPRVSTLLVSSSHSDYVIDHLASLSICLFLLGSSRCLP